MKIETLEKAGLTKNESKVYYALLEMGPRTAATIARRTGLHRRLVYDITERLIKKGLISYIIENKRKVFQAANPKRFLEIIEDEKNSINEIMPFMTNLFNQEKSKPTQETKFFKDINGIKSILEDQIDAKKEIFIIGASETAYDLMDIYFHWYDKKRVKAKIKTKMIFNKAKKKIKKPLAEIKYLPEKYSSNMAINIYGDKVAIILWKKEKPIAILIKDFEIAEAYKKHFDMMWGIAKT
jgi:HTH-type transcriptional regulator, sugar sensing transcriptional regulator